MLRRDASASGLKSERPKRLRGHAGPAAAARAQIESDKAVGAVVSRCNVAECDVVAVDERGVHHSRGGVSGTGSPHRRAGACAAHLEPASLTLVLCAVVDRYTRGWISIERDVRRRPHARAIDLRILAERGL